VSQSVRGEKPDTIKTRVIGLENEEEGDLGKKIFCCREHTGKLLIGGSGVVWGGVEQ